MIEALSQVSDVTGGIASAANTGVDIAKKDVKKVIKE